MTFTSETFPPHEHIFGSVSRPASNPLVAGQVLQIVLDGVAVETYTVPVGKKTDGSISANLYERDV